MVDKKKEIIYDIFFFYFLFEHLSFRKTESKTKGANSCLPSKYSLNYSLSPFKGYFQFKSISSKQKDSYISSNISLTHYQTTNFRQFQIEQSADDNFKFDENSRKFSKRVENTVSKGEIARYEQFFLFPLCFQKACFPGVSKGVIVWEWVKLSNILYVGEKEELRLKRERERERKRERVREREKTTGTDHSTWKL